VDKSCSMMPLTDRYCGYFILQVKNLKGRHHLIDLGIGGGIIPMHLKLTKDTESQRIYLEILF
jgi:hypothetical protein